MTPYSVFLSALYVFSFRFRGLQGYTNNSLFLLKGKDLVMEIETPKSKVEAFNWKRTIRSEENVIITYYPDQFLKNNFEERAEFSKAKYSLRLKNLALNESGLYRASDASKVVVIFADYHVTVQDQVSPVVMNASPVSLSSESCKVTVTCSTQSSSLNSTFTCTNQTCSEDGGDPAEVVTSDVLLQLYLSNGLIAICNHSNKVSWSKDTMEIKPLCFKDDAFLGTQGIPSIGHQQKIKIISICLAVLITIFLGCICRALYKWKKKNKRKINSPGRNDQSPNQKKRVQSPKQKSPDQSPTIYSMLDHHSTSVELPPPQTASPESVYAKVDKPRSA